MRKLSACLLALILLVSVMIPGAAAAEPALQHEYSKNANSGIRHEVCTTLEGTSADTYYTGNYSFENLSGLSGDALLQSLRTLMTTTHTHKTTYDDCRDYAVKTDCENGDGVTINLTYSSYITNRAGYINDTDGGWNREHVWPVSLGKFSKSQTPGCDLHHIRPTDSSLNGTRGNLKYGYATGSVKEMYGTSATGGAHGGKRGGGFMEPLDNAKGDVARICLYMYVRYGSEYVGSAGEGKGCNNITNVFQSVDVLLEWCALDPVDTWEMGRNEVVYGIQGNRNVFIDNPALAWQLFDREVPEDLTVPSGGSVTPSEPCAHANTEIRNQKNANCGLSGYTGDTFCTDCGVLVSTGKMISATGKHSFGDWQAIEGTDREAHSCTVCNFRETRTQEAQGSNLVVIIGVAAGVVVAGAAVAVVLVAKKKKQ